MLGHSLHIPSVDPMFAYISFKTALVLMLHVSRGGAVGL